MNRFLFSLACIGLIAWAGEVSGENPQATVVAGAPFLTNSLRGSAFHSGYEMSVLGFSADNNWLVVTEGGVMDGLAEFSPGTGGRPGFHVVWWDVKTGRRGREIHWQGERFYGGLAGLSEDRQEVQLVTGLSRGSHTLRRWKVLDGAPMSDIPLGQVPDSGAHQAALGQKIVAYVNTTRTRGVPLPRQRGGGPPIIPPDISEQKLCVYDVENQKELWSRAVSDARSSVVVSPDRASLAYVTKNANAKDSTIHVVDVATQQERRAIVAPDAEILYLTFSPSSQWLLATHRDQGRIDCWSLAADQLEKQLELPELMHRWPKFIADGKRLLVRAQETLYELDFTTGQILRRIPLPSRMSYFHVSGDDKFVAITDGPFQISMYDRTTDKFVHSNRGLSRTITSFSASADGQRIAAVDRLGRFAVWDLPTDQVIARGQEVMYAKNARLAADGTCLLVSPTPTTSRLVHLPRPDQPPTQHDVVAWHAPPTLFTLSPGATAAAYQRTDNAIALWSNLDDAIAGKPATEVFAAQPEPAVKLSVAANGRAVAAVGAPATRGSISAYQNGTPGILTESDPQQPPFAPGKTVRVWKSGTKTPVATFTVAGPIVTPVSLSAEGTWVAVATKERLYIRSLTEPPVKHEIDVTSEYEFAVQVSPDGKHVAFCANQIPLQIYATETGKLVAQMPGPKRYAGGTPLFSANGKVLYARDEHMIVQQFSVPDLQKLPALESLPRSPYMVHPLADDKHLVTIRCVKEQSESCDVIELATGETVGSLPVVWPRGALAARDTAHVYHTTPEGFCLCVNPMTKEIRDGYRNLTDPQWLPSSRAVFTPHANQILGTTLRGIQLWNKATGEPQDKILPLTGAYRQGIEATAAGTLITSGYDGLAAWNWRDGKKLWSQRLNLREHESALTSAAQFIVTAAGDLAAYSTDRNEVRILEVATGRETRILKIKGGPSGLSPDGRLLAANFPVSEGEAIQSVAIWETCSGALLFRLEVPQLASQLKFTPDGKKLLVGCHCGAIYVYDFQAILKNLLTDGKAIANLQSQATPELLKLLSDNDALLAWRAAGQLARRGADVFAKLPTRGAADGASGQTDAPAFVAQLASDKPEQVREASKKLHAMGGAAMPAIRAALEKDPSPAVRARLEILELATPAQTNSSGLAECRESLVGELNGSAEARAWLKSVAESNSGDVAREAAAALFRLERNLGPRY